MRMLYEIINQKSAITYLQIFVFVNSSEFFIRLESDYTCAPYYARITKRGTKWYEPE